MQRRRVPRLSCSNSTMTSGGTSPLVDPSCAVGGAALCWQPFGFAGGVFDVTTGIVRFGARDYDPVTRRWTQKDPIGFGGKQSNIYVYVGDEPINGTDPNGKLDPALAACINGCEYSGIVSIETVCEPLLLTNPAAAEACGLSVDASVALCSVACVYQSYKGRCPILSN